MCEKSRIASRINKAKEANKVRRVDRRTNALHDQQTNRRKQSILQVLWRT